MHIIAGKFKNRRIETIEGDATRPTTGRLREAFFNICQLYIEGAHFLDLFAGSGAMGLEALSRGAAQAFFVEKDKENLKVIKKNIEKLQVDNETSIISGDVFTQLSRLDQQRRQFDIIYADPPYNTVEKGELLSKQLVEWIDKSQLLKTGGYLFIEEDSAIKELEPVLHHLQFVSVRRLGRSALYQFRNFS